MNDSSEIVESKLWKYAKYTGYIGTLCGISYSLLLGRAVFILPVAMLSALIMCIYTNDTISRNTGKFSTVLYIKQFGIPVATAIIDTILTIAP